MLDYHVGYSLLLRTWNVASGALLVFLVPMFLTPQEQGYYFTFSSIIALQVFFELGMNFVLTQIVSSDRPFVEISGNELIGAGDRVDRISKVFKLSLRWYSVTMCAFLIVMVLFGFTFFRLEGQNDLVRWETPWILLAILSAFNLFISPFLSIFEGLGFVGEIARMRLFQSVASSILMVIVFWGGGGLFVACIPALMSAVFGTLWLALRLKFIKSIFIIKHNATESNFNWRNDILPLQWRVSVSWISGYLIFSLYNPIFFSKFGSVVSGKIGLILAVYSALLTLSISWVNANLPKMSGLAATGQIKTLNNTFYKLMRISVSINFITGFFFILAIYFGKGIGIPIMDRFPGVDTVFYIYLIFFLQLISGCLALYVRAFKQELFVVSSVATALISFFSLYFGAYFSLNTAIICCLFGNLLACLWTTSIFVRFTKSKIGSEF
jgi:hypothetical protein